MKKLINFIGTALVVILVVGFLFQNSDAIPNNAKVKLIPSRGYWLPENGLNESKIAKSIKTGEFSANEYAVAVNSTYGEMKASSETKSYKVPESWKTYADTYVTGEQHYLITSWITKKRWNADGTWNY